MAALLLTGKALLISHMSSSIDMTFGDSSFEGSI